MAVVGVEALWRPYQLTIPIEEGTQYHYGTFDLEGAKALTAEPATTDLRYHSWRSRQLHTLKTSNEELRKTYCRQGYLDMEPIPEMNLDHESYEIGIRIRLEEGKQYELGAACRPSFAR